MIAAVGGITFGGDQHKGPSNGFSAAVLVFVRVNSPEV
jgi:hypothetical protein